jgi:hypothetical protein
MTTESFWKKTAETLNNRCLELEGELAQMTKWRDGAVADANENHQKYVERKKQVLRTLYGGSVQVEELRNQLEAETERADANYDDFIQLDQEHGELIEKYQAKDAALDRQRAINAAHLRWIDGCTNWLGEHTVYWLKLLKSHGFTDGNSTSYYRIKQVHDAYHEVGAKYPWEEEE